MRVCVVGLGKVGLPLATQIASLGHTVVGCDIAPHTVDLVNRGECPIAGEKGLDERLRAAVGKGSLTATTDTVAGVQCSQAVVVIVPAYLTADRNADLSAVEAAAHEVASGLKENTLVVFETTLPVGTTRGRLGPILCEGSGLALGSGFLLAFSPERVSSGRALSDLASYPKIVGGVDDASTQAALSFYRTVLTAEVLPMANADTAEFVKLIELTYRDVNIALANEFALCAARAGVDIVEAIGAANSQPFAHVHEPGIGVGGHCVPVNPWFLINGIGPAPLAALARHINDSMPGEAVRLLDRELGGVSGRTVLILGLSYRANVKESYRSTTLLLADALATAGGTALVQDPLFSNEEIGAHGLKPASPELSPSIDAIVIQAYHDQYGPLDFGSFPRCRVVLDGRNVLSQEVQESLAARGLRYVRIGT